MMLPLLIELGWKSALIAGAALIVGVGIDEDESPWARWALAPTLQLAPDHLDALIDAWNRPPQATISLPPLGEALRSVCMPSYESTQMPLHPGRAVIEIKRALQSGDAHLRGTALEYLQTVLPAGAWKSLERLIGDGASRS